MTTIKCIKFLKTFMIIKYSTWTIRSKILYCFLGWLQISKTIKIFHIYNFFIGNPMSSSSAVFIQINHTTFVLVYFLGRMSRENTPQKYGILFHFTNVSISTFDSGLFGKFIIVFECC
jgi:hypothetical protein